MNKESKTPTEKDTDCKTDQGVEDSVCCSWCGEWGLKEHMYLHGGEYDWYHAYCVEENTTHVLEYLFGGTESK